MHDISTFHLPISLYFRMSGMSHAERTLHLSSAQAFTDPTNISRTLGIPMYIQIYICMHAHKCIYYIYIYIHYTKQYKRQILFSRYQNFK